ncbi:MAG: cytochrome c, partial [Bdellovibrionaceae bacterium]|nr:cytochrome c [Pseudobdellovibrionaceae bacterium]
MKKLSFFIISSLFLIGVYFVIYNTNITKNLIVMNSIKEFSREPSSDSINLHFSIKGPRLTKTFTISELMRLKGLRTIIVEKDPAYDNKQMTYMAVPLSELFDGVGLETFSTMSFKCLDGFSGVISKTRALNQDPQGAVAYLAIEDQDKKWPRLKPDKPDTAGPFYLIWENPGKSKIMTEEWPFQLAGFELNDQSLDAQFPNTVPAENILLSDPVRRGQSLFMTNCFVCHAFNGDGVGKIGPDLNIPYSPAEYLQFKHFSILVRNPQNLRKWEQARMPGFNSSRLSD